MIAPIRVARVPVAAIKIEQLAPSAPVVRLAGVAVHALPGTASIARFDVPMPAGTWIIAHGLGRLPVAQLFSLSGEQVFTDLIIDAVHITATFGTPTAGFVLAA